MSTFPTVAVLFALWVLLSGKLDAAHLGAGAVAALTIGVAARRLWQLPPVLGAENRHPLGDIRWTRASAFTLWLAWEVVVSSLQVAYVVLHPRLPISPKMVRLRPNLPHTVARLTLANTITLTPGTLTLEVEGDEFIVHALTSGSEQGVMLDEMERRVTGLFDAAPAGPAPRGNGRDDDD